jgi:hypothetical protein
MSQNIPHARDMSRDLVPLSRLGSSEGSGALASGPGDEPGPEKHEGAAHYGHAGTIA